jgi:dihydrofolate reductase
MARLVYSAICSLDGYTEDASGSFDWAAPDPEVHAVVNDLERAVGTYLYGRRMYKTMRVWADSSAFAGEPDHIREYAEIWQAADKVVYSRSLEETSTARTRLERAFDPDAVRKLKQTAERTLSVGGPQLAAEALRADLVDEVQLFVAPVIVGGGKRALPDDVRLDLDLVDERRFANGTVFLQYDVRRRGAAGPCRGAS